MDKRPIEATEEADAETGEVVVVEEVTEAEVDVAALEVSKGEGVDVEEASPSVQEPPTWTGDPAGFSSLATSLRRRKRWFSTLSSLGRSSTRLKMR